jgi:hypothetical protein
MNERIAAGLNLVVLRQDGMTRWNDKLERDWTKNS